MSQIIKQADGLMEGSRKKGISLKCYEDRFELVDAEKKSIIGEGYYWEIDLEKSENSRADCCSLTISPTKGLYLLSDFKGGYAEISEWYSFLEKKRDEPLKEDSDGAIRKFKSV